MRIDNTNISISQIDVFGNLIAGASNVTITKTEAEQLLNQEVGNILDEYDYDNIGDVKVYADDKNSPFYEEAKKILNWYKQVWDWFYEFIDNKEEINYDEFLENYPKFNPEKL